MTKLIPTKLEEMGIKCDVEKSYAHGNFVCVAINIISADARKGQWFTTSFACMFYVLCFSLFYRIFFYL